MPRARMSRMSCSARRSCCQGPQRVIMVLYVALSQRACSGCPSGSSRTQSKSCHALHQRQGIKHSGPTPSVKQHRVVQVFQPHPSTEPPLSAAATGVTKLAPKPSIT